MKSVTYWYQFFTAREELVLVPILHDVKFTKCEICGLTGVRLYNGPYLNYSFTLLGQPRFNIFSGGVSQASPRL